MKLYAFYVKLEGAVIPILCEGVEDDPILTDHLLFTGTRHVDDKVFPTLKVQNVSLPKADVTYYVSGEERELEKLEAAPDLHVVDAPVPEVKTKPAEKPTVSRRRLRKRKLGTE